MATVALESADSVPSLTQSITTDATSNEQLPTPVLDKPLVPVHLEKADVVVPPATESVQSPISTGGGHKGFGGFSLNKSIMKTPRKKKAERNDKVDEDGAAKRLLVATDDK